MSDTPTMRIVSDGTAAGTRVLVDDETLAGVTNVTWTCSVDNKTAVAFVTVVDVPVDVYGKDPG